MVLGCASVAIDGGRTPTAERGAASIWDEQRTFLLNMSRSRVLRIGALIAVIAAVGVVLVPNLPELFHACRPDLPCVWLTPARAIAGLALFIVGVALATAAFISSL